jgi:hypothetical protein
MNSGDFVSGIQRNDAKTFKEQMLFYRVALQLYSTRFGLEIEKILEDFITHERACYRVVFKIVPVALGSDLFEGVDIDRSEGHR